MFRVKLDSKPDLIGLARNFPNTFPALLASNTKNEKTGRFSLLFAQSKKIKLAFNQKQLIKLFNKIDSQVTMHKTGDLPFHSGWFVYLSYASIKAWENVLSEIQHDQKQPLALAIRCKSAIVIDHIKDQYWLVGSSLKKLENFKKNWPFNNLLRLILTTI